MALINITVAGIFAGLYAYITHRSMKFINQEITSSIDVNDNFDDFIMTGLPLTKKEFREQLEKKN